MILSATGIRVTFAGRAVLNGLSFTLGDGDRCAVLGRSGSGKTTLLLVLAGLLKPDAGTLDSDLDPADVVYVPQAPSLIPELTAAQNASLGLRVRGVRPALAEERGQHWLRELGLTDVDDALPAELSGGMQQRVALARALAVGPRLLLADEPTGALDQATGARTVGVLTEFAARTGATVVVATHDAAVAARFPRTFSITPLDDKEFVG